VIVVIIIKIVSDKIHFFSGWKWIWNRLMMMMVVVVVGFGQMESLYYIIGLD